MRSRRGAAGFTLIEVLIAMVVSMAIVLPLLAWTVLGFRQQHELTVRSHDDNVANFLALYLRRDVASASSASAGGNDCADPAPTGGTTTLPLPAASSPPGPTPAATVVLGLDYSGVDNVAGRIAYVVVEGSDGGTLRRHRCDAAGFLDSDLLVADQLVAPAAGWTSLLTCAARAGADFAGEACGRVTVTVTGPSHRAASVTAVLRTGPMR